MINLEAKVVVVPAAWKKKRIMQLPKTDQRELTTTAYRNKESIRLLCKVVTKHQLPKPSPRGGQ